jgi:hypothetical protein
MHHQIKSYAYEESMELLLLHYNWTVKEMNQLLKIHSGNQIAYLKE